MYTGMEILTKYCNRVGANIEDFIAGVQNLSLNDSAQPSISGVSHTMDLHEVEEVEARRRSLKETSFGCRYWWAKNVGENGPFSIKGFDRLEDAKAQNDDTPITGKKDKFIMDMQDGRTYPVEVWTEKEYDKAIKEKPEFDYSDGFRDFLFWFTENTLIRGMQRFGQFGPEPSWTRLWREYSTERQAFREGKEFDPEILYTMLDKALVLEYKGEAIPDLLK